MIDAQKVEAALELWRGLSEDERALFGFGQKYAVPQKPVKDKHRGGGRPTGSRNRKVLGKGLPPPEVAAAQGD